MYNIGDEMDQEAVKVFLFNKDLGVDMFQVIERFDAELETIDKRVSVDCNGVFFFYFC